MASANCEVQELGELHKHGSRYSWVGGGVDTVVTWTLAPTPGGGTRLRLEQSGFRTADKQAFEGAKARAGRSGWPGDACRTGMAEAGRVNR